MEAAFKATSQEVLKGNEIIHKFQNEIRNLKSKLKLRNVATTQQEKLLGEKEASLERQVQENQGLSRSLAQKDEEIQRLEESLQATRGKLEESRELLKTNENVIGWLNKQINEQMMGGRVPPAGPASLPFSTIRHSSSPFTSAPHIPQFSSTPAMGVNSPLMTGGYLLSSGLPTAAGTGMGEGGAGGEDGDRQVLGSLAGKENAKHQVVFRGGAAGKTIGTPAVPSPLSSHSLSAAAHGIGSMTRSPTTSTGGGVKRSPAGLPRQSSNEPSLDPKYLPHPSSLPEPTQAPPIPTSVTPGVLRPPSGGRGGRGGRGRGGKRVTEQQIPLTSAYFPNS
ncbi:Spindle assembly abnormal protein 6 homolog [Geodia barretti]|nr:Spindle assembly abnormal protein 6 homolog [Geodia barretti]